MNAQIYVQLLSVVVSLGLISISINVIYVQSFIHGLLLAYSCVDMDFCATLE
jgi:hypothetical protein